MFEVNQSEKPPKPLRRVRRRKYPFKDMKPGDFFFIPNKTKNTMAPYASEQGKLLGCKFKTRLIYMRESIEGWLECSESTPGAMLGIWIGRVE